MKPSVTRQQMETFALALELAKQGKTLAEETFSDLHARFRARDPQGNVWTIGIHTRRWHRLVQGGGQKRWVAGAPPERLDINQDTLASLESLSPAPPKAGSKSGGREKESPTRAVESAKSRAAKQKPPRPSTLPE